MIKENLNAALTQVESDREMNLKTHVYIIDLQERIKALEQFAKITPVNPKAGSKTKFDEIDETLALLKAKDELVKAELTQMFDSSQFSFEEIRRLVKEIN
jgi:hypothetical protein